MIRAECPVYRANVGTFYHDGQRIFTGHGGSLLDAEICAGSGWLVEDNELVVPLKTAGRKREPIRHGTTGGYSSHYNRNEKPCDACRKAKRDYDRERHAARTEP